MGRLRHHARMLTTVLLHNGAFVFLACVCLAWARWRTPDGAPFPGPRPVGPVFKVWLVVIWAVGLILPVAAIIWDGIIGGHSETLLALIPYIATFFIQVAMEIFVWKRWRSPIWVIVPCLHLPWRLYQVSMGFAIMGGVDAPLTMVTLWGLLALWIINIGVHYTNIVNTLRWDYHPADASFPSLKDPRVFVANAQDERDRP
jgi:hypothetical protein